jgi:hypothetical protein
MYCDDPIARWGASFERQNSKVAESHSFPLPETEWEGKDCAMMPVLSRAISDSDMTSVDTP